MHCGMLASLVVVIKPVTEIAFSPVSFGTKKRIFEL